MWKYTPLGNTSLPNNVGGQGRRLIITHFSTKRNRNGRIAAARGRKPLPMGEVALRSNDGEGKPVSQEPRYSDRQALRQSDAIAAPARPRQRPCPLRRFAPALPRGEPFHLHDTAPLRWNKWRSSYKLNDTSLNISCSPTWRSSPHWRSTYFASWAQVRHLGEVRFMALVR